MIDGRRIDLNLLLALDVMLTELNVTRAASRLHISQPALSTQLSRLRTIFNDPLLIPTNRGMVPTALTLELRQPLGGLLDAARGLVSQAQQFDPLLDKIAFCVASSDYVQVAILVPSIRNRNDETAKATSCRDIRSCSECTTPIPFSQEGS